jgi:beta-N-acetylhexosaminidase
MTTLSPRDRAAQLVWPQVFGDFSPTQTASWDRVARFIATEHVGGFVMSIGSPMETAAKINAMQRLSPVPLMFGSDYESGAGSRSHGGFYVPNAIDLGGATVFPRQMALGATRDSALAYEQGRITAIEGRALGIQIAFAPVLDVNNNPKNPVIGARSFGEDPELVARLGTAVIRGLQDNGMLSTAKHFPGHGDTEQNSHLSITTVNAPRSRLDSVELVPFRRAVAAGVTAIMTFHGVVPALDTAPRPATLSPVVMQGLLRHDMHFGGLLITDALDMNGVLARVRPSANQATVVNGVYGAIDSPGLAEVVKQAVDAGNDVLLMPLDVPTAIDAVVQGVQEGRFTQARVDSSVRKILALKFQSGLAQRREADLDHIRSIVGIPQHLEVADRIAERSITLARDSLHLVPFLPAAGQPRARVLSVTLATRADLAAGVTFDQELRQAADVRSLWVDAANPSASLSQLLSASDSVDDVVIGSYLAQGTTVADPNAADPVIDMFRSVLQRHNRTVVVAFGNPYLLQQVPFVSSYVVAWSGYAPSQRAAARALTAKADISGRLPISIPPALRLGDGEQRQVSAFR